MPCLTTARSRWGDKKLRDELLKKGHALRELLEALYPDAGAVHSAVGEIAYLLENYNVDISDQWVSAHVMVEAVENSYRTNLFVR